MTWTEEEIKKYVRALYERRGSAIYAIRKKIIVGSWQPKLNQCHQNVTDLCELKDEYSAVRGWIYFDLAGKFVAHSIVRSKKGILLDITPSEAKRKYPFIDGNLSEEMYGSLVLESGMNYLYY